MRGFKAGAKPNASRSIKSGAIQGQGSGTSDDVKATVEGGSYVMPADSSAQIGAEQLQGMGTPVDVNLSNGEQLMSPEQVHAVGLQTLDAMKNATHIPSAGEAARGFSPVGRGEDGKPELFFAGGGPVFSSVDPDELGRSNTPQRNVTPRPTPIYVDGQGTATRALPSQSRALVPAGPVTGTDVVPARQPGAAGQTAGSASQADFHTNSRGETGRGFSPSSSRAVVPAGPATGTSLVPANQPAPDSPAPKASAQAEPDYRARAEVKARAARDTAAFQAERAAQDARFDAAKNQPAAPAKAGSSRAQKVGKAGGALAIAPTLMESAADDSTARYAQRFGMDEPTGDGSAGDIAKFAALRGLGFASDLGNNLTMGVAGNLLYQDMQGEQAPSAAVAAPAPQSANVASAQAEPVAPQTALTEAATAGQGNGYQQTGIGGIVGKKDENGQYSFTNEAQAVAGASGQLDMPNRGGTFSVVSGGREGMESNLRAAEILRDTREAGAQGFRPGGVTVVRDSSRDGAAGRAAVAAASTPYSGSPGGQLTASQLRTLSGLQESGERNATDLAREQMQQDGADARTAIAEVGANQRFAQSNALDQQRTAAEVESKGFATRSAQRIEKLYELYDKAKPEDRPAIAEQLRVLTGKDQPARYAVAAGGQVVDPLTQQLVTQPAVVFNQQTGEVVSRDQAAPATASRPIGTRSTVGGETAVWDGNQWVPQKG